MKRVFITGGDGFLGVNLLEILTQRGYDITVMIQPGRNPAHLDRFPIKTVEGDLTSYESVLSAMEGADVVMHLAAVATVWPSRHPIYWKVNVEGTRNMIEAAKALGVQRFLHIGSARSVFEPGIPGRPGTELDRTPTIDTGFEYSDSKRDGQLLVEKAAKEDGFPAIIMAPTFAMIGPNDAKPSTGRMIMAVWAGKIPAVAPGGKTGWTSEMPPRQWPMRLKKGDWARCISWDMKISTTYMPCASWGHSLGVVPPAFAAPRWVLLMAGRLGTLLAASPAKSLS